MCEEAEGGAGGVADAHVWEYGEGEAASDDVVDVERVAGADGEMCCCTITSQPVIKQLISDSN